jgi:hypothetical protein
LNPESTLAGANSDEPECGWHDNSKAIVMRQKAQFEDDESGHPAALGGTPDSPLEFRSVQPEPREQPSKE